MSYRPAAAASDNAIFDPPHSTLKNTQKHAIAFVKKAVLTLCRQIHILRPHEQGAFVVGTDRKGVAHRRPLLSSLHKCNPVRRPVRRRW